MEYQYTLEDIYKIFQQSEDKVAKLQEFKASRKDLDVNWDRLIEVWS